MEKQPQKKEILSFSLSLSLRKPYTEKSLWVRLLGWVSFLITKPIPPHLLYCNHPFIYIYIYIYINLFFTFLCSQLLYLYCVLVHIVFISDHLFQCSYYSCWVLLFCWLSQMGIGPSPRLCIGSTLKGKKSHLTQASRYFIIAF